MVDTNFKVNFAPVAYQVEQMAVNHCGPVRVRPGEKISTIPLLLETDQIWRSFCYIVMKSSGAPRGYLFVITSIFQRLFDETRKSAVLRRLQPTLGISCLPMEGQLLGSLAKSFKNS